MNVDCSHLETPKDELVFSVDTQGWRIEVLASGVRMNTFDFSVRPAPRDQDSEVEPAIFGGMGYRSADAAKDAAIARFDNKMELGLIKPRVNS